MASNKGSKKPEMPLIFEAKCARYPKRTLKVFQRPDGKTFNLQARRLGLVRTIPVGLDGLRFALRPTVDMGTGFSVSSRGRTLSLYRFGDMCKIFIDDDANLGVVIYMRMVDLHKMVDSIEQARAASQGKSL